MDPIHGAFQCRVSYTLCLISNLLHFQGAHAHTHSPLDNKQMQHGIETERKVNEQNVDTNKWKKKKKKRELKNEIRTAIWMVVRTHCGFRKLLVNLARDASFALSFLRLLTQRRRRKKTCSFDFNHFHVRFQFPHDGRTTVCAAKRSSFVWLGSIAGACDVSLKRFTRSNGVGK